MTDELTDARLEELAGEYAFWAPEGTSTAHGTVVALVAALRSERLQTNPLRYFVGTLEAELERERTQNCEALQVIAKVTAYWRNGTTSELIASMQEAEAFVLAALSTREPEPRRPLPPPNPLADEEGGSASFGRLAWNEAVEGIPLSTQEESK